MDGRFCGGQIELHQLLPHFLHRNPFCLMGLRLVLVDRPIEPRTCTPAQLLGPQGGNIDK